MNIIVSAAICLGLVTAFYLVSAFSIKTFNKLHGLIAVILGIIAFVPVEGIVLLLGRISILSYHSAIIRLITALVLNGIIVESIKTGILFFIPKKNIKLPAFFSYGFLSGLAFAAAEIFLLFLSKGNLRPELNFFALALTHSACAGLDALFVYSIKTKNIQILPYIFAILIQGVYTYFTNLETPLRFVSVIVIFVALFECRIRYKVAKTEEENKQIIWEMK